MRIIATTFITLLFTLHLHAQNEFIIKGYINGLEDGIEITLNRIEDDLLIRITSDTVKSGTFVLNGKTNKEIEQLMIMGRDNGFPSLWLDVYVKPGADINIIGNNKLLKTWKVESNIKEQKEAQSLVNASIENWNKVQQISAIENTLIEKLLKSPNDITVGKSIWSSIDSLRTITDSIKNHIYKETFSVLESNPVSDIWMNELKEITWGVKRKKINTITLEQIHKLCNRLNKSQKNSKLGKLISLYLSLP